MRFIKHKILITAILFSCSALITVLLFLIFISHGGPSVEDHIILKKSFSLNFSELFTSTLHDAWNAYDSPVTSKTNIYRPFYLITFKIDGLLYKLTGLNFLKFSNLIYFFILIFIFSLFVKQNIDANHAIPAILIYALHPCHADSQFASGYRMDVLVGILMFSMLYAFYLNFKSKSSWRVLLIYLLFILFIFTKETASVAFLIPALAFLLFVFVNNHDFKAMIKLQWREIAVHTFVLLSLTLIYIYIRTFMFEGVEYMQIASVYNILFNLVISAKQIIGVKDIYLILAIPLILYMCRVFFKSKNKLLLGLILLFTIGIVGPTLIYYPARRFTCTSALVFVFLFTYFLKDIKKLYLKAIVVSFIVIPLALQFFDIKKQQLATLQIMPAIKNQLENMSINSDTIAVILPRTLNAEGILFESGIPEYFNNLENFKNKQIIVLGVIQNTDNSYFIEVNKAGSRITLKYPVNSNLVIPHLPYNRYEFNNKFFNFKNPVDQNKAVFDLKSKNFQILYFEKVSSGMFAFKTI